MRLVPKTSLISKKQRIKPPENFSLIPKNDLKDELQKINENMNQIKRSIIELSGTYDPAIAAKLGQMNYEDSITKRLKDGVVDINVIPSRNTLEKDFNSNEKYDYLKVDKKIIKLPKSLTNSYPNVPLKDRVEPQPPLHPEVQKIFKSLKRYWDGRKWVEPTGKFSDLNKLKENFIKRGIEWPDLKIRDLSLQPGIEIDPQENINRAGSASIVYRNYIQNTRKLHGEIARTHRKIRALLYDIPYKFIYPLLKKMGYSHEYIKYSKKFPHIDQMVKKLISDPKFGRAERLEMLFTKLTRLQKRRLSIYNGRYRRNNLFQKLVSLNKTRESIIKMCREKNVDLTYEDHKPIIRSSVADILLRKIKFRKQFPEKPEKDFEKKKYRFKGKCYNITPEILAEYPMARSASKLHPDKIKNLLTTGYQYNAQRDLYIKNKKHKRDDLSRYIMMRKRLNIRTKKRRARKERIRVKEEIKEQKRIAYFAMLKEKMRAKYGYG